MAANTRYQPAPQRDSLDDEGYAQPPPQYSAEDATNAALLGGVPRGEDDNMPDDFKFGGVVSEATLDIRMQFVRKVYAILTVQLLATTVIGSISFASDSYRHWIQSNSWMMWLSIFGAIGFMLLTFWKRKSYPTNLLFLGGFTALEAYSVSVIVSLIGEKNGGGKIVLEALGLTLGLFVALTLFACQTKYDFTSWMPYLFFALWALILFGFMTMFFPAAELAYGIVAALIFCAYILVDTQLIMRHYHVEEEIAAAISLYLDILNLFLAILRILNSQSNN